MESQNFSDKIEFRNIVLKHIEKILDLSTHELRDTTIEKTYDNHTEIIEHEDLRVSYCQSVENLAYVLMPYFDDKIKKVYKNCIYIMNAFGFEVKDVLKEKYDELVQEVGEDVLKKTFVISMRLKYAKKLFCELNLLLHRCDYLKSAVYGEDKSEIVEDIEEETEGEGE